MVYHSWLCIVYSFVYDYIDIEIGIKKMIALICLIYIIGYSVFILRMQIKKIHK